MPCSDEQLPTSEMKNDESPRQADKPDLETNLKEQFFTDGLKHADLVRRLEVAESTLRGWQKKPNQLAEKSKVIDPKGYAWRYVKGNGRGKGRYFVIQQENCAPPHSERYSPQN